MFVVAPRIGNRGDLDLKVSTSAFDFECNNPLAIGHSPRGVKNLGFGVWGLSARWRFVPLYSEKLFLKGGAIFKKVWQWKRIHINSSHWMQNPSRRLFRFNPLYTPNELPDLRTNPRKIELQLAAYDGKITNNCPDYP